MGDRDYYYNYYGSYNGGYNDGDFALKIQPYYGDGVYEGFMDMSQPSIVPFVLLALVVAILYFLNKS